MSAFVILIIGAGIGIAAAIWVTGWIENGTRQIEAAKRACLDNEAADHDEPTRADVEADFEWAEVLAAVGLTPEDVRARWNELNGDVS